MVRRHPRKGDRPQSRTEDAIRTFLDIDYVTRTIAGLEKTAGKPISGADKVVRTVGKKLALADEHITGILDHFIQGGQRNAGGVLDAVTADAQTITSADVAADVEAQGVKAMELAATM